MNIAPFKTILLVMFTSLHVGCASYIYPEEQSANMISSHTIEFLYFDGCPNTPKLREELEEALDKQGLSFTQINMTELDQNDLRRGYGSPTILVDNQDLFDAPIPNSGMMSCRIYPDGLPNDKQIISKLNEITP
ncbi:MAG: hypothetical protein ACSHX5_00710 [Phycisphaerales bacterium]